MPMNGRNRKEGALNAAATLKEILGGTVLRVEHEGLPPSEPPMFDGGWGTKFRIDLRDVLDGARDPAAATSDETGLTHHPAYVRSR